jgi:DNA-binding NtrC family response regulator
VDAPTLSHADDQPDVLEALRLLLKARASSSRPPPRPRACSPRRGARVRRRADRPELRARHDLGPEGLDLLSRIQALDPTLPVVVMTAWGSVEVAVEAMRRGARDFVQKPWDNARLLAIVRTQIELAARCARAAARGGEPLLRGDGMPLLIAESRDAAGAAS